MRQKKNFSLWKGISLKCFGDAGRGRNTESVCAVCQPEFFSKCLTLLVETGSKVVMRTKTGSMQRTKCGIIV